MFKLSKLSAKYILIGIICLSMILYPAVPAFSAPDFSEDFFLFELADIAELDLDTNTKPAAGLKNSSKNAALQRKAASTQRLQGGLGLTADAAVLIDANSGQVLFEKNAYKRRPPASTTKIMTTILAMEYGKLDDVVTISDKAARVGQATIHLDPGEKLTLENLIEGALVKSGNDACVAISEHIAGLEEIFIRMMNAKAKALGAHDTQFANTNGLPNAKHYSTAYDLALMARYGMKLPRFSEITRFKEANIEFIEPNSILKVRNTNKLLWMYEFADGVKTGTTNAAGKCLVSSATKNGRQLIAVVLDSPGRFSDSIKLLEYGFNNFQLVSLGRPGDVLAKFPLSNGEIPEVPAVLGDTVEFLALPGDREKVEQRVIWDRDQEAPVQAGEKLGEVQFWLRGKQVGQTQLYSDKNVKKKGFIYKLGKPRNEVKN